MIQPEPPLDCKAWIVMSGTEPSEAVSVGGGIPDGMEIPEYTLTATHIPQFLKPQAD